MIDSFDKKLNVSNLSVATSHYISFESNDHAYGLPCLLDGEQYDQVIQIDESQS